MYMDRYRACMYIDRYRACMCMDRYRACIIWIDIEHVLYG